MRGDAGETEVAFARGAFESQGIEAVRRNRRYLTFEHRARRDAAGTPDLLSVETVRVVGGVIFVATARPGEAAFACPDPKLDFEQPSGERLRLDFAGTAANASLHDWELLPLIEFVASGSDALFTYMGVHAQYHTAFVDNLAGFNLFLVDTFRSLAQPARAHRMVATPVPGYAGEAQDADRKATRRLRRWMRSSHLMFTDHGVDFVFRPAQGRLAIDGSPYWIALKSGGGAGRIDRRFDDPKAILAANPVVFGSAFRLARHGALFRYLKADCPERWRALQSRVAAVREELDLYTIPVRRMPYSIRS